MQSFFRAKASISKLQLELKEQIQGAKRVSNIEIHEYGSSTRSSLELEKRQIITQQLLFNSLGLTSSEILLHENPDVWLSHELIKCVDNISAITSTRLLFIWDTCELIRSHEEWIMNHFLVPILNDNSNIGLVYSGRENSATFRTITLNREQVNVRGFSDKLINPPVIIDMQKFNRMDIKNYLDSKLNNSSQEQLISFVQEHAKGVPFAIDLLTNVIQIEGAKSVLGNFNDKGFQKSMNNSFSNMEIIKTVANRFFTLLFE